MTTITNISKDRIFCACGCGETRPAKDITGKLRKYIYGHVKKGENSPSWRGDDIGYATLHVRLRKIIPVPEFCTICNSMPPNELANMTGTYNLDTKNWKYVCFKCHRNIDLPRKSKK